MTKITPCPFCKKTPGTKVGPPAMARCITPDCAGTKLAAVTLVEWNANHQVKHSPEYIRSISEKVYRAELARNSGNGAAERMIAKYNEDGEDGPARFSRNAGQYDHLTRAYLEALEIKP